MIPTTLGYYTPYCLQFYDDNTMNVLIGNPFMTNDTIDNFDDVFYAI